MELMDTRQWADAFRPERMPPLQARLYNALCIRQMPCEFTLHGTECVFELDPWLPAFQPLVSLTLQVGEQICLLEMGAPLLLALHPAGEMLGEWSALPAELVGALAELALSPLLVRVGEFLGVPVTVVSAGAGATSATSALCSLSFQVSVRGKSMPLVVHLTGETMVRDVSRRLESLPLRKNQVDQVPVAVGLELGTMRLPLGDLRGFAQGDVLLPESFMHPAEGITLRLSPDDVVFCKLEQGQAHVTSIVSKGVSHEEGTMTEQTQEPMEIEQTVTASKEEANQTAVGGSAVASAPSEEQQVKEVKTNPEQGSGGAPATVDVNQLEVTVCFELDRRNMSVAEVAALSPGYSFVLDVDPQAQVALRINGKTIGSGRLVDLNGALGVQLTSIGIGT